jgi:hypothetical protein
MRDLSKYSLYALFRFCTVFFSSYSKHGRLHCDYGAIMEAVQALTVECDDINELKRQVRILFFRSLYFDDISPPLLSCERTKTWKI